MDKYNKKLEELKIKFESSKDWTLSFFALTITLSLGATTLLKDFPIFSYLLIVLGVWSGYKTSKMFTRLKERYNDVLNFLK